MEERSIGSLSVSVVGLGCNQIGTKACDGADADRVVHEAVDAGITFFDTSDEYGRDYMNPGDLAGWGRSEEVLGRALRHCRDAVVVASKGGPYGPVDEQGAARLAERSRASATGIRIAVEESLTRLGTDRIDLYQLHFPDPGVPLEETLGVLHELVTEGKVREIGCSNFSGQALVAAAELADQLGRRRFASTQSALNLFQRKALDDLMPACERLGTRFIPYYPLASGVLTGKYRRDESPQPGTRLAEQVTDDLRQRMLSPSTFARLEALETWAEERDRTILELAFAWLLGHAPVASVIAGAARPGQAAANAGASDWRLTPEEVAEVTALVAAAA
jgi:aryl-alcohol dehydrogenase-like predicted oxidoreductase